MVWIQSKKVLFNKDKTQKRAKENVSLPDENMSRLDEYPRDSLQH